MRGGVKQYEKNKVSFAEILNINDMEYISSSYLENEFNCHVYIDESSIYIDDFEDRFDYSWTKYPYIAHAFGGINGDTYTNSLEAFLENYKAGHRVFEVDFTFTSDHKLVALHDWSENTTINVCGFHIAKDKIGEALTEEEFLNMKVKDKYTTLSFDNIVEILQEYPDIYIVTDTKETQEELISEQFQYMVNTAKKTDISILNRIIPQIYNEKMYETIMSIYEWKSIIYTLYNQGINFSPKNVVDFSYKNGIKVITTYTARAHDLFLEELLKRQRIIYMHTYNTEKETAYWKGRGVYGFYTDFLTPLK